MTTGLVWDNKHFILENDDSVTDSMGKPRAIKWRKMPKYNPIQHARGGRDVKNFQSRRLRGNK